MSILNNIFKKRIGIKRKENINRSLLLQLIFSIILVIAVIATKHFGNNQTDEYLSIVKGKLGTTFNIKQTAKGINSIISNYSAKLGLNFGASDYAAPVSGIILNKYGDELKLGEIIGKLNFDNKLLHIEIWEGGTSIDPSKLFKISE